MAVGARSVAPLLGVIRGLFVGIEDYVDDVMPDLAYCNDDAEVLHRAFDQQHDDFVLLLESDATRANILGTLSSLLDTSESGDLLVMFVASHGVIAFNDFFFLPHDGMLGNILGTGISASLLVNSLSSACDNGLRVLLIFDTCHAGAIGFDISKSQTAGGGGFSCFFSCSPAEKALESADRGHGFFSFYMVEALNGAADQEGDGVVTLRNLFDHVYRRTQQDSNQTQHPILIGTLPNDTPLKLLP